MAGNARDQLLMTALQRHRYSFLPPLQEMEESPPPPPVPPKDRDFSMSNDALPQHNGSTSAPASGSKRRRDAADDVNFHYHGIRNDPLESQHHDSDRPTPSKRSRSQIRASDGYASDTPSQKAAQLRRKKGIRNLSNLNLRHAASVAAMPNRQTSPSRESKFQEGSLNDKPSQQPPSVFTRMPRTDSGNLSYVDELMADYHDGMPTPARDVQATIEFEKQIMPDRVANINARNKKEEEGGGGVFRFGKSWGSTFKPIAIWNRLWNDTKEDLTRQNKLEAERKARLKAEAEARYAKMKKAGQFAASQPALSISRDSGIAMDSGVEDGYQTDPQTAHVRQSEEEHSKEGSEAPPTMQHPPAPPIRAAPEPPEPPKTIRGRLSRMHLRKPSLSSLTGTVKRAKSDFNLAAAQRESSASASPTKAEFDGSTSILRSSASKYDLKKQHRLSKRVSNLEEKLQRARVELDCALAEASPGPKYSGKFERFTPVSSVKSSYKRSRFVPGALPTLPSERILFPELRGPETYEETVPRAEEEVRTRAEIDLSTAFDNIDEDETVRPPREASLRPHAKEIFRKTATPQKGADRTSDGDNLDPMSAESADELTTDADDDTDDTDAMADHETPTNGSFKATRKSSGSKKRRSLAKEDQMFLPEKTTSDDDAEWEEAEAAQTSHKRKRKSTGKGVKTAGGKRADKNPNYTSPQNKVTKKKKKSTTGTKSKKKADADIPTIEIDSEKTQITDEIVTAVPSEDELARSQTADGEDPILEPVYEEEEEVSTTVLQDEPSDPTATATPSRYGRGSLRSRSNSPIKRGYGLLAGASLSPGAANRMGKHVRSVSDTSVRLVSGANGNAEIGLPLKRGSKDEDFQWPDDVF